MAEKYLDGAQIAGRPVDDRRLGPPQRVGAIFASHQANPAHPLINKPGKLAGAEVSVAIDPAWEDVIGRFVAFTSVSGVSMIILQ